MRVRHSLSRAMVTGPVRKRVGLPATVWLTPRSTVGASVNGGPQALARDGGAAALVAQERPPIRRRVAAEQLGRQRVLRPPRDTGQQSPGRHGAGLAGD